MLVVDQLYAVLQMSQYYDNSVKSGVNCSRRPKIRDIGDINA